MESKFCPHCGAGVSSTGSLFCGQCGKPIEKPSQYIKKAKVSGNNKPLLIGVAAVVVILAVILVVIVISPPKNAILGRWLDDEYESEWEFFKDGTVTMSYFSVTDSGKYRFLNKNTIEISGLELSSYGNARTARVEIKGNKMKLGDGSFTKMK